jgi:hypothetical protein
MDRHDGPHRDATYNPARSLTIETVIPRITLSRDSDRARQGRDRADRFIAAGKIVTQSSTKEAGHG